jgi:hypothetical protein
VARHQDASATGLTIEEVKATPSPGRTVSAGAVLNNFFHFERARFDERDGEILAAYAQQLAELVGYLEITANDYEEATVAYRAILDRWLPVQEAVKERTGGTAFTDDLTADELALHDEVGVNGLTVYLRIETFYVFAKILLDRLARLIPHYFGHADGVPLSKHRQLPTALPAFAERKGLTLPPALTEQADELQRRISDYRDKTITHGHSPRTYRGTALSLNTGEAMISTHRLYPERAADAPRQSETPRTLLPLIENYVDELVAFLSANGDKADPEPAGFG